MTRKKNIIISIVVILVIIAGGVYLNPNSKKYSKNQEGTSVFGGMLGMATSMVKEDSISAKSFSRSMPEMDYGESSEMGNDMNGITLSDGEVIDRMVIKNGSLSLVVKDIHLAMDFVANYAKQNGGFVINSNFYKHNISPSGNVSIKVPASLFDQSMLQFNELGQVTNRNVSGRDITEEYVDSDTRLNTLEITEQRFLEIMKDAKEVKDILEVENQLKIVRIEIEQIKGRMKYLKQSSDLSTINVNFTTDPEVLPTIDDTEKWQPIAIIKSAVRSLIGFGQGILNLIIWLIIFIPLWILIYIVITLIKRKMNNDKK